MTHACSSPPFHPVHGRIPVVIAAGGQGRRMGGDKPARVLDGITLLDRALAFARRHSHDIAIAAAAPLPVAGVPVLIDDQPDAGPVAALASALRFARDRGAGVVALVGCDLPFLPDDLLARLEPALAGAHVALPCSAGQVHPLAGLWKVEVLATLPGYQARGRGSLIGLAREVGESLVEWPHQPLDPFANLNTPGDLAAAEAVLRSRAR